MSRKRLKIIVFISSFVFFLLLVSFTDLSGFTHSYNINESLNDTLHVQITFADTKLNNKNLSLYYSDSLNPRSAFSENKKETSLIKNNSADFGFYINQFPKLLRIQFNNADPETVSIKKIVFKVPNKEFDINLTRFNSHPSIKIIKKRSNLLQIDLTPKEKIKYDPFIYLEKPLYIHKLTTDAYFFLFILLLTISYLLSELAAFLSNIKNTEENINSILLFLLIISLLFKQHWISKSVVLVGLYLLFLILRRKIHLKKVRFFGFLSFFSYALISLFWSANPINSLPQLTGFIPFMILPVWLSSFNYKIPYEKIFHFLGLFYSLVALYLIYLGLIRFHTTGLTSEFFYHTLSGPLSTNAIYTSIAFLLVYLIYLYLVLKIQTNQKLISFLILSFLFVFILLLNSKMVIVLLFLCSLFLIISSFKIRRFNLLKTIVFSGILIIIFAGVILTKNRISNRFNEISQIEEVKKVFLNDAFGNNYRWNGLTLRLFHLRAFLEIQKEQSFIKNLLGVGLNNSQQKLNEKKIKYKLYSGKTWEKNGGFLKYNYHNQYLQTFSELGLIGFVLLLNILFRFIIESKKYKYFLLFSIVFVFFLIMFTESILVRQKGITFFVLFPILAMMIEKYTARKDYIEQDV